MNTFSNWVTFSYNLHGSVQSTWCCMIHHCVLWLLTTDTSIPTPQNVYIHYSGTELLHTNPLKWGHLCIQWNYSNTMKWGHLCIQWNSSIPTPWNENTSVYRGTPLFQLPEMRTPLYRVELLYSNTLKWEHLCIEWNPSIPTPWNENTSV